jgi:hypothetical protein
VISRSGDQRRPLSVPRWTNTRRLSCADTMPDMISFSVTRPLRVVSSTTVPSGNTTGAGLPAVASPLSDTTVIGPHVQPPSAERRSTTRIAPVSPAEETRPSANASTSPFLARATAGIRKVLYPCVPEMNGTDVQPWPGSGVTLSSGSRRTSPLAMSALDSRIWSSSEMDSARR